MADRLAGLVLPDDRPVEEIEPSPPANAAKRASAPKRTKLKKRREPGTRDAGDWIIMAGGAGLAVACALFPWYIFVNQQHFGTAAVTFGKPGAIAAMPDHASLASLVGARRAIPPEAFPDLDFSSTGTIAPASKGAAPVDQPFPGDQPDYRLVAVANGRAMIEDGSGFWVVEHGSWLPDGSRARALEQRDGKWVLVTSTQAVIPLSEQ